MDPLTRFQHSGFSFDVRDGGPPAGESVVLLHGFPQDSSCWDGVSAGLQSAGFRTLAPDLRGYSPEARPPGRRIYRLSNCGDDLLALLDAAELQSAHLVGHDWGGASAWHLAARCPARVRTLTVLSTPHPAAMRRAWFTSSQGLKSWYMGFFQLPLIPEMLLAADPKRTARSLAKTGLSPGYAQSYANRLAQPGAARGALGWYRAIPFSWNESLASAHAPTTYVWGRHDPYLGRAAAEATGRYVVGDYRFIEWDAGHWLPETRPAEIVAIVVERIRGGECGPA